MAGGQGPWFVDTPAPHPQGYTLCVFPCRTQDRCECLARDTPLALEPQPELIVASALGLHNQRLETSYPDPLESLLAF